MIFIFIFGKTENKENINNNIREALLDQNFICSQTLEVQTERLSRFSLTVNFILGFLFNFIRTLFSFFYRIRFTIVTRILFTFLLGLDLLSLLGLDLLSLLEVCLLSLQVFLFYKQACLLCKTESIELLSNQRIFSQILCESFIFLSFFQPAGLFYLFGQKTKTKTKTFLLLLTESKTLLFNQLPQSSATSVGVRAGFIMIMANQRNGDKFLQQRRLQGKGSSKSQIHGVSELALFGFNGQLILQQQLLLRHRS